MRMVFVFVLHCVCSIIRLCVCVGTVPAGCLCIMSMTGQANNPCVSTEMFTGTAEQANSVFFIFSLQVLWWPTAGDNAEEYRGIINNRQQAVRVDNTSRVGPGCGEEKSFNWPNKPFVTQGSFIHTPIQLAADM